MTSLTDRIPRLSALWAIVAASLVLLGWQVNLPLLRSAWPGLVSVNPMSAVCFGIAGASLWLLAPTDASPRARLAGRVLAALVLLVAGLKLIELAGGFSPAVDGWLFANKLTQAGEPHPNRMAPNTAIALMAFAAALLTLRIGALRRARLPQVFGLITAAIAFAALVGYSYGVMAFYGLTAQVPMSLISAFTLLVLSTGVLLTEPDVGILGILRNPGISGILARRFLPLAAGLPLLLGWLTVFAERAGLFEPTFGLVLLVLSTIGIVSLVVWTVARDFRAMDEARIRAESDIEDSRAFLDSIVENLPSMVFVKDAQELRFVRFNRAGENLLGYSSADLLGKNDYDFFPKEQADAFTQKDREVLYGTEIVDIPEEVIQTRANGERILHTRKVPVLGSDGRPRFLLGISVDITERKRAEAHIVTLNEGLRVRTQELETANRELEAFSYSVSHDLRAPVRHIDGFVDLLAKHLSATLDDEGRRLLQTISKSARKMGALIDDLLGFSRMGRAELRKSAVMLNAVAGEVVRELQADVNGRQIEWVIGDLPPVQADPAMLRLALTNLLANAVKYTRTRPLARIELSATRGEDEVVVTVSDNGVGFDPAFAQNLFGVFQRLHRDEEFEGTGIGLANVRRIINRHGGRTWGHGAPDHGASFSFSLPDNFGGTDGGSQANPLG